MGDKRKTPSTGYQPVNGVNDEAHEGLAANVSRCAWYSQNANTALVQIYEAAGNPVAEIEKVPILNQIETDN